MSVEPATLSQDLRQLAASEWVLRLQSVDVDEQTTAEWLEWCQADPENFAAFEQMRALWHGFDGLIAGVAPPPAVKTASTKNAHRRMLAMAAGVVLAAGLTLALLSQRQPQAFIHSFETSTASLSRQTLPDGSTLALGARSSVRVQLTANERRFALEDGEAFFEVAKDRQRPFIVEAGDLEVLALGTAFNVRKTGGRIVVTVAEGLVRVAPGNGKNSARLSASGEGMESQISAGPGHQVSYSLATHGLSMTRVPATLPAAWRSGRLEFVDEPLGAIVDDLNRYSSRRIYLADARLSELIFTGTLRGDAIDDWLQGLEAVFPLQVQDQGGNGIVLTLHPPVSGSDF